MLTTLTGRPLRNARAVLLLFVCMTIIALIAQTWWAIAQDRRLTVDAEKRNSLTTVRGLEEQASRILFEASHATQDAAQAIAALPSAAFSNPNAIHQILARQMHHLQPITALWVTDLKGMIRVHSSRFPAAASDLSGQHHFLFLSSHPDHQSIAIGPPVRDEYEGGWVIPVARHLHDASGKRIGMIGASIRAVYLAEFYSRITRGKEATVSFRTNEGILLARAPFDASRLGENIANYPAAMRVAQGSEEGTFEELSMFTHGIRLFAYRKATDFPVSTVYSLDLDAVLAPWRARSAQRITITGATILLIGALTFILLRHIRRLQYSEESLSASENRYRTLYEGATDGVFLLDRRQRLIDCNNAAARLFGLPDKHMVTGRSADDFFSTDASGSGHAERQRAIEAALSGEPQQCEWMFRRGGRLHTGEIALSRAIVGSEPLMLCIFRDISARKQSEEEQKGQNRILHIIASGADLHTILTEIIQFVEQRAPHSRCMMLLLDEDRSRFVWGAGPSIPPALMRHMSGLPVQEGNSAASEAVLTQYPIVVDDTGTHPLMREMRTLLIDNNVHACGSWPIMGKRGQILGSFCMLFGSRGIPSAEDVQLVAISTDLAGIAIESRRAEDRIKHLAHYDELTGLPNRLLYIQYLNRALAQAERAQGKLGVLFLDLDRFKNINDTFGHDSGDAVLRAVSANFRNCLRESDIIARVGGDEFIVLVSDYAESRMLGEIAERLLIEAARPFDIHGQECQLSVSIGIAAYPVDGLTAQMLLKNADIAMYRAKTTGKNNYQFYSSEMNTHTVERIALENRLRRAIERREFVVHYQPKVDVRSGRIVGAEALVRWKHPEQGMLLPGDFIGLAEEAGLIGQIGMLVLEGACRGITAFRAAGIEFGRVAINLSATQFKDLDLVHDVRRAIETWQLDPSMLELEITESMVMHDRDQAIEIMDSIKALGITLSIDDFGTGYSSLAYLKRFPVDSVKIDKSFINDIPQDQNDLAIVQAIIAMAHTLDLKVIAEGVENPIQLEHLRNFGCDEYQGFYFSHALSEADFIMLAHRHMRAAAV